MTNAPGIKSALNGRAEDFARWLFPAGHKEGNEWRVGSLRGEPGQSLGITISGSKVGLFKDFSDGPSGSNLVELLVQARSVSYGDALKACADWLGTPLTSERYAKPSPAVRQPDERGAPLASKIAEATGVIPDSVWEDWKEGADYLDGHPAALVQMASSRSWPVPFVQYLVNCFAVSAPLVSPNERGIAFLVVAPEGQTGSMTTRPIGLHVRLKPKDGAKPTWLYFPNKSSGGGGVPALPFIIGEFDTANLLIITEGQWDALTFALAAGWLGDGCLWPSGVGLIGIRGANGVNTFLRWYERFWPDKARCLLLADADTAGGSWSEGENCFAKQLARRCAKVAVVDCYPHKDFNDLYRSEKPGLEVVGELLASHDMAVESEVLV